MITSSASLAADDLSIRCRVRRSQYALNPEFGDAQEMTCTMRHWETTGGAAASPPHDDSESDLDPRRRSGSTRGRSYGSMKDAAADSAAAISALLNVDGDKTAGRELLLCPVHASAGCGQAPSYPLMNSMSDGPRALVVAGVFNHRFHSFGSTPGVTSLPNVEGSEAETRRRTSLRPRPSGLRRDRIMSEGELPPHRGVAKPRHGSQSSSSGSGSSSGNGKRKSSLPRLRRQSAAAAFAVRGLSSAENGDCSHHDLTALQSYHIPLGDVIVVDLDETSSDSQAVPERQDFRLYITTVSNGYFEFVFQSKNAHDVLLAFLQASLPRERITNGAAGAVRSGSEAAIDATASGCCDRTDSYDMDGLVARKMKETVRREGIGEKIRRRFVHIAGQLQELTLSVSECFCGGGTVDVAEETAASPEKPERSHQEESHVLSTPVKKKPAGVDRALSVEDTPATAEKSVMQEHTPRDGRGSKAFQFSFEPDTPLSKAPVVPSMTDTPLSKVPAVPSMTDTADAEPCSGPITPVETSESEEESRQEEYGHDDLDPKMQTVDI